MDASALASFFQSVAHKYQGSIDWLEYYAIDAAEFFGGTLDSWRHRIGAAYNAHHKFEVEELGGKRDDGWAGWYANYIINHADDVQ